MLKKLKRCLAAITASAAAAAALTGCTVGSSTAIAMTIDDYDLKSGIFIFYQNSAFEQAKSLAKEDNEELDTEDESALKAVKLKYEDTGEELAFLDWVEKKTMEQCTQHVALIKKFDELGLELDKKDVENAKNYAANMLEDQSDSNVYYLNGIGEESFAEIIVNSYRSEAVFDALYGEGGTEGVTEAQIKEYYLANNVRTKYVDIDLHDTEGNDLDAAGKKEVEDLASKLLSEVKGKSGKELLTAFDEIQEECDAFVQEKTAEAAEENESEGENETSDEEPTTEAETENEDAGELEENDDAAVEAPEDGDGETGSEDDAEASEDDDTNADDTDKTDDDVDATGADTGDPAVTTAPETSDSEETTTTTTTNPYANERIIPVVTTKEGTKEEDVSYSPCKKVYDWAQDKATKIGAPELIRDDENGTIYIAVKLDIKDRLTADDLWSEDRIETVRSSQFSQDMQDKLDEWAKALNVKKNEDAIDRYKPFGYKQPETTAAAADDLS